MKLLRIGLIISIVLAVVLAPALILAQQSDGDVEKEGPSTARKIWNIVWRFINFFILAFLIVKYGRKPFKEFLSKHSTDINEEMEHGRKLLTEAEAEYQETQVKLDQIEHLIGEVQEYMKTDGERNRQRILDDAQARAAQIMEDARERANTMIGKAREEVRKELIEMAWREAENLIRENISPEDQDRLIGQYVGEITEASQA